MNFKINCGELKKMLQIVSFVVPKHAPIQVLENFLFIIEAKNTIEGTLTITGSNLELVLSKIIEVETEESFEFLVPADLITRLITQLNSDQLLSFSLLGNSKINILADEGRYILSTLKAKEFPESPNFALDDQLQINGTKIKEALYYVDYAVDEKEQIRINLTGILIEGNTVDKITLVATDGKKLSVFKTDLEAGKEVYLLVPHQAGDVLKTILPDGDIEIKFNKSYIQLTAGDTTFLSRLIQQKFPNYRAILPTDNPIFFTADRKELLNVVRSLKKLSNPIYKRIYFLLNDNKLKVYTYCEFEDLQEVNLECNGAGKIEISFNADYLIDVFSSITEESVKIEMSAPDKAAVITSNAHSLNLLMPVRIETKYVNNNEQEEI